MGFRGVKAQAEEDRGKDKAGGGGLSSTNMGFRGVEAEGDRGKDKAGGAYPQPIWGSEEGKLQLKKTEAGTRPGGLILNQCGFPRCGS